MIAGSFYGDSAKQIKRSKPGLGTHFNKDSLQNILYRLTDGDSRCRYRPKTRHSEINHSECESHRTNTSGSVAQTHKHVLRQMFTGKGCGFKSATE